MRHYVYVYNQNVVLNETTSSYDAMTQLRRIKKQRCFLWKTKINLVLNLVFSLCIHGSK